MHRNISRSAYVLLLACVAGALPALGQVKLPVPRNIQDAYDKGTRSPTGAPGMRYWQDSADYSIKVGFDPGTRLVKGSESIVYFNRSPDTLRQLVFKLYPNLYQKGAQRNMSISPEDLTDGVAVTDLTINGSAPQAGSTRRGRRQGAQGTDMVVRIPALQPGQSLRVDLDFSYILNKGSHIRTGEVDSGAFFIAYFFPRIAVYDDIDGWNRNPYLGEQEFYNDFCHFHVDVAVPGNYVVWATGTLQNPDDVFQPRIAQRLKDAATADGVTNVIDSSDWHSATLPADTHTWTFEANDVTDFVFAIANHYLWKASSLVVDSATGRRTRVDVVFNPDHKDYYEVIDFARKTVESMSLRFPKWPFPYPHETVFDGLDQMEYPMMVNDNPLESRSETIELVDHEIFHTMFPFYMGVNETKYAWMDEGWATIGEWVISPMIDPSLVDEYGVGPYAQTAGKEVDLPIIILSTQQEGTAYYLNSYPKPGMGYLYARDVLGDQAFFKGLHRYIGDWHGKHPGPLDFFNSMNAGSGVNLNWFWKRWFYEGGTPDLKIASVRSSAGHWVITVDNVGGKPVPVDLTLFYRDGSREVLHRSVGVWASGSVTTGVSSKSGKPLIKVTLGGPYDPDTNQGDNVYLLH